MADPILVAACAVLFALAAATLISCVADWYRREQAEYWRARDYATSREERS
jgi:hypothetical protein